MELINLHISRESTSEVWFENNWLRLCWS